MCSEPAADVRRFHFFMGKGGVGKSTSAALAACFLAARGKRVLLLSLDPAHNQADIFDRRLSGRPRAIGEHLRVAEVDHRHWIDRFLHSVQENVRRTYAYQSAFNIDHWFDILKDSPGIEEYGLILAFQQYRKDEREIDVMILDMPPTALTMKFLRLPGLSLRWLKHLTDLRSEILKKKEILHKIQLTAVREIETDRVLSRLRQQEAFYTELKLLLETPAACSIHLVFNPEQLSLHEAGRICSGLGEIGLDRCLHPLLNKSTDRDFRLPPELFPGRSVPRLPLCGRTLVGMPALEGFLADHGEDFESLLE